MTWVAGQLAERLTDWPTHRLQWVVSRAPSRRYMWNPLERAAADELDRRLA